MRESSLSFYKVDDLISHLHPSMQGARKRFQQGRIGLGLWIAACLGNHDLTPVPQSNSRGHQYNSVQVLALSHSKPQSKKTQSKASKSALSLGPPSAVHQVSPTLPGRIGVSRVDKRHTQIATLALFAIGSFNKRNVTNGVVRHSQKLAPHERRYAHFLVPLPCCVLEDLSSRLSQDWRGHGHGSSISFLF